MKYNAVFHFEQAQQLEQNPIVEGENIIPTDSVVQPSTSGPESSTPTLIVTDDARDLPQAAGKSGVEVLYDQNNDTLSVHSLPEGLLQEIGNLDMVS